MPLAAPVSSPLPPAIELNAGVDASIDDAINAFDKVGTRYILFSLIFWFLIFFSSTVPFAESCENFAGHIVKMDWQDIIAY